MLLLQVEMSDSIDGMSGNSSNGQSSSSAVFRDRSPGRPSPHILPEGSNSKSRVDSILFRSVRPSASSTIHNDASSSSPRPNLSVAVESPLGLSPASGSGQPWQQPYSDLSRFPSGSYRFRGPGGPHPSTGVQSGRDWGAEGSSKFMSPLPSPLDGRSRTLSDAASDVSSLGNDSLAASTAGRSDLPSQISDRTAPARSRTRDFFAAMDSAFSPPPPPRMPYMNGSLHSSRNSDDGNTLSNSIGPTSTSAPDSLVITTTTSAPPSAQPDRATFEHFDALPTAFSTATVLDAVYSDPHRRSMSAGTSTTPTVNTSFVTQSSVHDSPAPSPTESQAARWAREPPQRLPTLPANMPENAKEPSSVLASDVSRSRSRSASNSTALASVNDRDARPRTVSSANTTLKPIRETEPGSILCNKYLIDKCIGLGAFSRVLLARSIKGKERATVIIDSEDDTQNLLQQNLSDRSSIGNGKPPNLSSPKKSHSRTRSLGRSSGTSTPSKLQHSLAFSDDNEDDNVPAEPPDPPDTGESVAIKMISRSHVKKNDRMRISILREVEVLKVCERTIVSV